MVQLSRCIFLAGAECGEGGGGGSGLCLSVERERLAGRNNGTKKAQRKPMLEGRKCGTVKRKTVLVTGLTEPTGGHSLAWVFA